MAKELAQNQQNEQKEYVLIDAVKEYGKSYAGARWIIATSLTEETLKEKYPDLLSIHSDYELVSMEVGNVINESNKEMQKLIKRDARRNVLSFDECTEYAFFEGLFDKSRLDYDAAVASEQQKMLMQALDSLSSPQKERILRHIVCGQTVREIAKRDGVNHAAVVRSIGSGLNILKKFFGEGSPK